MTKPIEIDFEKGVKFSVTAYSFEQVRALLNVGVEIEKKSVADKPKIKRAPYKKREVKPARGRPRTKVRPIPKMGRPSKISKLQKRGRPKVAVNPRGESERRRLLVILESAFRGKNGRLPKSRTELCTFAGLPTNYFAPSATVGVSDSRLQKISKATGLSLTDLGGD